VPQDINQDSTAKSTPAGDESPKVDKPSSPQAGKIMPDSPMPSSPKGVQGSPDAGGAPTSPTHATPDQDPTNTSSVPGPTESPRTPPPSPQSHGLEATGGSQRGEGSSMPQPEEVPQQRSQVVESQWGSLRL
jgi:hypothetical protein